MPFVQRVIEPKYLSRTSLWDAEGKPRVTDDELEAVTNNTLSNALRQLASLVLVADDIFTELGNQLQGITKRSNQLKLKIGSVEEKVAAYDPKKVSVPESDICTFALLKDHYKSQHDFETNLFGSDTRPRALRELYEAAAKTPVHFMRQMDRWRRDGHRSSRFFLCTPVLGAKRKRIRNRVDIDIETRMPAAVEELRRWTSSEALGDITVAPDCTTRIAISALSDGEMTDGTIGSDDEGIDHKLPSPEEQVQVVALKFPAEIVAVDVSGRSFDRMSMQRRSLLHGDVSARTTVDGGTRRRTRTRKPRSRRRNTLAGTDQKEIQDALTAGEEPSSSSNNLDPESPIAGVVLRSKSSDILRSTTKRESPEIKKSHFNSLKQWGKNRLRQLNRSSSSKSEPARVTDIDDINIYETVTVKRKRNVDKERKSMHERNPSVSSSEKSGANLPVSTFSSVMNMAVKLRDSSAQRRLRRSGGNKDEPHSSSGNWSASSESGRASIGSEITTTTAHPKSTTSTCTSNNSLNLHAPSSVNSRRKFNVNTSASGSVTSEGTLTPDIIHDLHEDGETSSVYSCDTEGYYTSFHMDSGLKTLKEEDLPMTPIHSTTAFSNSTGSANAILTAENEYELFGKGSTSTTTSSAGTVCTALRASDSSRSLIIGPAVPERKSSLSKQSNKLQSPESSLERDFSSEKTGTVKRSPSTSKATVVAMIHQETDGDVSPDSGHNTSSSPIESINSPNGMRSGSEFEFSESSDMEGPERIERIRVKTAMTTCRIPSMCVITPPVSDDESLKSIEYSSKSMVSRPQLPLPVSTLEDNDNKVQVINVDVRSGYATVETLDSAQLKGSTNTNKSVRAPSPSGGTMTIREDVSATKPVQQNQPVFKASLLPLNNMFGRLKSNFTNMGLRKDKSPTSKPSDNLSELYDSGEYVTIADVRNNNEKAPVNSSVQYVNDSVNQNLNNLLSGKIAETEYVSLNELPKGDLESNLGADSSLERKRKGARVTLDAEGKVIYSSDSLRRRKGAHTTFEPGPFVRQQDPETKSPIPIHRTPKTIRPVTNQDNRPLSPQMGKVVIKASSGLTEIVRIPPSTIVTPSARPMSPKTTNSRGAYVHVQDNIPTHEKERVPIPSEYPMCTNFAYQADPAIQHYDHLYGDESQFKAIDSVGPIYRTLPAKKTKYIPDVNPVRSVTPDIMRGLTQTYQGDVVDGRVEDYYRWGQENVRMDVQMQVSRQVQEAYRNQVPSPTVRGVFSSTPTKVNCSSNVNDVRHIISPIPSHRLEDHNKGDESIRISPIDPRNAGSFKSSTPQMKTQEMRAAADLGVKLLSPKKSTMTNEELYAIIHKSKKKLNIENTNNVVEQKEEASPRVNKPPETGYIGEKSKTRLSWSPSKGEYVDFNQDIDKLSPNNDARSRQSWACNDRKGNQQTSRLDFKKLLLQHGKNVIPTQKKKLSAVEQLKLSKEQPIQPKRSQPEMSILELSGSPRSLVNRKFANTTPEKPRPAPKIMSPRSHWRFTNPRSDVLSSTILEDCREDESPNSSTERKGRQSGIAQSNTVKLATETTPSLDHSKTRASPTSLSQRIQAQRAQFFSSTPSDKKINSPPTLETAF